MFLLLCDVILSGNGSSQGRTMGRLPRQRECHHEVDTGDSFCHYTAVNLLFLSLRGIRTWKGIHWYRQNSSSERFVESSFWFSSSSVISWIEIQRTISPVGGSCQVVGDFLLFILLLFAAHSSHRLCSYRPKKFLRVRSQLVVVDTLWTQRKKRNAAKRRIIQVLKEISGVRVFTYSNFHFLIFVDRLCTSLWPLTG